MTTPWAASCPRSVRKSTDRGRGDHRRPDVADRSGPALPRGRQGARHEPAGPGQARRRPQAGRQGHHQRRPASPPSSTRRSPRRSRSRPASPRPCQDRALAVQLRSYSELELAAELATQERDLGRQVIADPTAVAAYTAAVAPGERRRPGLLVRRVARRAQPDDPDDGPPARSTRRSPPPGPACSASPPASRPTVEDQTWVSLANDHLDALESARRRRGQRRRGRRPRHSAVGRDQPRLADPRPGPAGPAAARSCWP